jgi:hypothetical protein
MKNPADVLKQKEAEIQTLQHEIEALRIAIRLCSDAGDERADTFRTESTSAPKPIRGVAFEQPEKALKQFP